MTTSTFAHLITPTFIGGLDSLQTILAKADEHVSSHAHKPKVYLEGRLYPDMFSVTRQVQIATDLPRRGLARMLGETPSSVEDNETTFAELQERIAATRATWQSCDVERLNEAQGNIISAPVGRNKTKEMSVKAYAMSFLMPNFYFHITTAYNILRHDGVALGKRDYLASLLSAYS